PVLIDAIRFVERLLFRTVACASRRGVDLDDEIRDGANKRFWRRRRSGREPFGGDERRIGLQNVSRRHAIPDTRSEDGTRATSAHVMLKRRNHASLDGAMQ